MDKIIVTGATGFIGRQTIPFLKNQGFEVHAITSKEKTVGENNDVFWHSVDIFDYGKVTDLCRKIQATNLLHLAWHDVPNERLTSPMNIAWVEASLHLIREFKENGGNRIVLAGSCAEYDWRYGYCSENITPIEPWSLYGECKSTLNRIVKKYAEEKCIHYSCGRIFFVYGPYESEDRLIAYVIKSLLMNQRAVLSHGSHIRDYLHVKDVAGALVKLLLSDVEGSVNIGSGQPKKLSEIVDLIGKKLNKPELITYGSRNGSLNDPPVIFADITRLRDELGWVPEYDLENGIDATIDWWKARHKITVNGLG